MANSERHNLLSGTAITSLGTLASRVLGLARDTATAALFGLAAGGVLDALLMAFRIPNLFRALFGEGALTASYVPVFTQTLEKDRDEARQLYRATMRWLATVLVILTISGETAIGIWAWFVRENPRVLLLAGLLAVLLPYLILVCLAALSCATLQALGRFAAAAFAPAVLNFFWIVGAIAVAPRLASSNVEQAYLLAVCILIGGLLQWMVLWPSLRREWLAVDSESRHPHPGPLPAGEGDTQGSENISALVSRIRRGMLPTMLALTVTQLNTLSDSVVAWVLAAPHGGPQTISWLGNIAYPMQQGAVAAIYFGERVYQLPLGLIGVAAATVVFPLLSRHAARGDRTAVACDLTLGVRLVLLIAIPCAVELAIMPEPIARLLYQHGQFTPEDVQRAARMIAVYGAAVWAYCTLPVLVRGFYAMDDRIRPLRIAVSMVALNLALDLTLIWPLAETGLAASTAISAVVQTAALAMIFSRRHEPLLWRALARTIGLSVLAAAVMGTVSLLVLHCIPEKDGVWNALVRALGPMAAGGAAYLAVMMLIGRSQWRELRSRN
jgi:putative peptidoglycan lipid II flippase